MLFICPKSIYLSTKGQLSGRTIGHSFRQKWANVVQQENIYNTWTLYLIHFKIMYFFCLSFFFIISGFPGGTVVKNPSVNAGDSREPGLIPGSGRSPGEGNGNPLQYSCWETPWTEEPDGLQFKGSQRVRHYWVTKTLHQSVNVYCKNIGNKPMFLVNY